MGQRNPSKPALVTPPVAAAAAAAAAADGGRGVFGVAAADIVTQDARRKTQCPDRTR